MIGVLHETGIDLHLTGQNRLEVVGHVFPGRNLLGSGGELGVGRDHVQLFLLAESAVT